MARLFAVAHPIVVDMQSTDGISVESILVFAGGFLAAVAAVVAAVLTTKSAERRLQTTISSERKRVDRQLGAERDRAEAQLAHDRFLAERAEASISIERVARVVAKNTSRVVSLTNKLARDSNPSSDDLANFRRGLDELREEANVLAVRFGGASQTTTALGDVIAALNEAIPWVEELPLSDDEKAKMKEARKEISRTVGEFLFAAKASIESYRSPAKEAG